jgi:DNA-binding LacI/PurR family transcriptional regulator
MSALADVAELAGVSKATASRALSGRGYVSEETRQRVVSAAARLGFVASTNAASLVTGQTKNVGLVIPFVNRWYFGEVLDGIEQTLLEAGYDLTLYKLREDETQRRRVFEYFLVRKRVDAVIAVGIALSPDEVDLLNALGKPIVGLGGLIDGITTLSLDDNECAQMATRHLIELGHRRIVHLGGSLDRQMDFRVHQQRLDGYLEAMNIAGLPTEGRFYPTDFTMEGGYDTALRVLADPLTRPTAIVAGCDEIAFGTLIAARQLGVAVPRSLSIIGIDGHDHAAMFGLTTLAQEPAAQGKRCVELLMELLLNYDPERTAEHYLVDVRLDVRTSTTVAPALT